MDRDDRRTADGKMTAEYCKVCKHERMGNCTHPAAPPPGIVLRGVPIVDLTTRPDWCPLVEKPKRPNVETSKEK